MPRANHLSPGGVKLLQEKQLAIIATVMPDGSPQTTPVWVDVEPDGSHILINTVASHLKANNINRDPRVSITVVDSQNPWRSVMIRGTVVDNVAPTRDRPSISTCLPKNTWVAINIPSSPAKPESY